MNLSKEFHEQGFHVVNNVYNKDEINTISNFINNLDTTNPIFRKTNDLFAIRQFIKEFPEIKKLLFHERLKEIIKNIGGEDYFIVKSIYFDKPEKSNWFVSYHQDLTISVDKKIEDENFSNWTNKHNQFAVQPPIEILENIVTVRIHLDDTNEDNGALKVLKKSHLKSICRIDSIEFEKDIDSNDQPVYHATQARFMDGSILDDNDLDILNQEYFSNFYANPEDFYDEDEFSDR